MYIYVHLFYLPCKENTDKWKKKYYDFNKM